MPSALCLGCPGSGSRVGRRAYRLRLIDMKGLMMESTSRVIFLCPSFRLSVVLFIHENISQSLYFHCVYFSVLFCISVLCSVCSSLISSVLFSLLLYTCRSIYRPVFIFLCPMIFYIYLLVLLLSMSRVAVWLSVLFR
jgi:hypothetical protein